MKVLGIHMDPIKNASTNKFLNAQQPSWNDAAISFLARIIRNTNKWKIKSTKLILIIALAPKQAVSTPSTSDELYDGHYILKYDGNQSIQFFTVYASAIEMPIHMI